MKNVLDVWLDGRFAGKLMRGERDQVEFLYYDAYRDDPSSTPLSASIPKGSAGHGPDTVLPWLSNLLPIRRRYAAVGRRSSTSAAPTHLHCWATWERMRQDRCRSFPRM